MRLPTFLIIGAMKAGTTSLFRWLEQHPDVAVSHPKELYFFSKNWDRGVDWYRHQFPDGPQRAVGEASPAYMTSATAIRRIAETLPEARLIAVLRDPVDRAYSHYCHEVLRRREDAPFADAVRRPGNAYVEMGRYIRHLDVVGQHVDRESLHVALLDDLVSDPAGSFATVCRFLGIDTWIRPGIVGATFNATTGIRSLRVHWWVNRRRLRNQMPLPVATAIRRLNRKPLDIPPMEPVVASELRATFADDTAALGRWLGRDLSSWLTG